MWRDSISIWSTEKLTEEFELLLEIVFQPNNRIVSLATKQFDDKHHVIRKTFATIKDNISAQISCIGIDYIQNSTSTHATHHLLLATSKFI